MTEREINTIRVGTRGSALALQQTQNVINLLAQKFSEIDFQLITIKTTGDRNQDTPLEQMGGTGVFVKEIERALFEDMIDIAVHSAKDLPASLPEGFYISAVLKRQDVEDTLISRDRVCFDDLPKGAVIATGSVRRKAFVKHFRPDLEVCGVRGNVDTRLRKLQEGKFDATILARAGLNRLGLSGDIAEVIPSDKFIPAPGQGIVAVEALISKREIGWIVGSIDDKPTHAALEAERSLLRTLKAGCSSAVGGLALWKGNVLKLNAAVLDQAGRRKLKTDVQCDSMRDAEALGIRAAENLLINGAGELINE